MWIDRAPGFSVKRRLDNGSWASSSIAEFVAASRTVVPTVFVMHGNQVDAGLAVAQGMQAYRAITAAIPTTQPLRFVIWSWPSDKIPGILKDVRVKAARANSEGKYLAWTVHQFDPTTPVSFIGFSYGARIATGALHLLAGGTLNGFSLPPAQATRTPLGAVLVAAALHNDWLAPGQYHGRALEVVDAMLLVNNGCDAALKRYRFVDECLDAEALGYTGLAGRSPMYQKVWQVDACCDLGKAHNWEMYLGSPRYTALMRQYVLQMAGESVARAN
jgi:hypothetical protein